MSPPLYDAEHGAREVIFCRTRGDRQCVVRTQLMFVLAGHCFADGATSLAEVRHWLACRSCRGEPRGTRCGIGALNRCCNHAETFFGRQFGSPRKADLFTRADNGSRQITGMTELGVEAWAMARDYLITQGIVEDDE